MEAYETRVAESEKKKLRVPIPVDEEIKSQVCSSKREWGASWCEQYSILFCRGLKERRHDYFSWLRITQVLATATILGMLWWQSGSNNPDELQDQVNNLMFPNRKLITDKLYRINPNQESNNLYYYFRQDYCSSLLCSGVFSQYSQPSLRFPKKERC